MAGGLTPCTPATGCCNPIATRGGASLPLSCWQRSVSQEQEFLQVALYMFPPSNFLRTLELERHPAVQDSIYIFWKVECTSSKSYAVKLLRYGGSKFVPWSFISRA
ncbi:Hypothetical predicted protein [Pelobates cultripes]|uniref:Uncharacterized protein n=1 Tax=Pelobates cultripes TaxID=61616 RepID=A0AAD1TCR2_PELCU|nr:Hypothetical predicted protein [Pelobates cultripes]